MKLKSVLAAILVFSVVFVTGCSPRNNNNSGVVSQPSIVPPQTSMPDVTSSIEEGLDNFRSDVENGISDALDNSFPDDFVSGYESEYDDWESERDDISGLEPDISDLESQPARAAMSTDFEKIGALNNDKKGWGPGVHTDKDKRPVGSIDYQEKYGKYGAYFIAPNNNKIYLTFDEGYENGYTGDILDTLAEKGVKAVFFITYDFAKSSPELVKRMVDEGHILGNHTKVHKSLPDMSTEEIIEDVNLVHEYVKANFGYTMTLFRPPMGEFSERTLAVLDAMGYKSVFWSFAYMDWDTDNQPLTIKALDTITSRCHPGAIYLLHAVSKTNSEVLGEAIEKIQADGYEFARFDWPA